MFLSKTVLFTSTIFRKRSDPMSVYYHITLGCYYLYKILPRYLA
uniref:Uncharacterized protein n=1 Tax=Anguilla anguilla TaxID=7936 RepID=A0A0E9W8A4_ANGAN